MTLALDGVFGQRQALAALPRGRPGIHGTGGWMGPRDGLVRCGKSRPPPGFDPRNFHPVTGRYIDWAISAHFKSCGIRNYVARLVIPDVSKGRNALILEGEALPKKRSLSRSLDSFRCSEENNYLHFILTAHLHFNLTDKYTFKRNDKTHFLNHSCHSKAIILDILSVCVCVCVCVCL